MCKKIQEQTSSIDSGKYTLRPCYKLDSVTLIHYFYRHMFKNLLVFVLLATPIATMAQCKDTLSVDQYHYCGDHYNPVCGCDNVTYRSPCAAQYWGGIMNAQPGLNYNYGVCGNFDFDFVPNPIGAFSLGSSDSHLHIYMNETILPATYTVYILDVFNKVKYQSPTDGAIVVANPIVGTDADAGTPVSNLDTDFFSQLENGVYFLIVIVNGEQKTKKIIVTNPK
jgi:hypothetical protein